MEESSTVGQGGGVFIVFEARRGHVEALFLAVFVMIDDEGRHEGPVLADAASKFLRQRPGKGDAVAFDTRSTSSNSTAGG